MIIALIEVLGVITLWLYIMANFMDLEYGFLKDEMKESIFLEEKIGKIKKIYYNTPTNPIKELKGEDECVKYIIKSDKGIYRVCNIMGNIDNKKKISIGYIINGRTYYNLPTFNFNDYESKIISSIDMKIKIDTVGVLKQECRELFNMKRKIVESVYFDEENEKYLYFASEYSVEPITHERTFIDSHYVLLDKDGKVMAIWSKNE